MLSTVVDRFGDITRKVLIKFGLIDDIIGILNAGRQKSVKYSDIISLFSRLMISYAKEDRNGILCPYCVTQDRQALLPHDDALENKVIDGKFISKIVDKNTQINENIKSLLRYMSWENAKASCAIITQLFIPSHLFKERLEALRDIMDIKDSLRQMRIKLIFSPSIKTKAPCGVFKVIRDRNSFEIKQIKLYINLIADYAKKDTEFRDILLRDNKPDLILMEEVGLKAVKAKYGDEKARKIFFTNEVNFGVPNTIAAERYNLSPYTGLVEVPEDEICRDLIDFKTYLTNYLIISSDEKERLKSQESRKLAEDNAYLRAVYTYLVLQEEKQHSNANFDEKTGEIVGNTIGHVIQKKIRKPNTGQTESQSAHSGMLNKPESDTLKDANTKELGTNNNDKESSIAQVMECMGVSREEAIRALESSNWDSNSAVNFLI